VRRKLRTCRRESAAMKALETLPLPQFGKAWFVDPPAALILGASGWLTQDLRHRFLEFLTLIAL
jgi:hypothetical protein